VLIPAAIGVGKEGLAFGDVGRFPTTLFFAHRPAFEFGQTPDGEDTPGPSRIRHGTARRTLQSMTELAIEQRNEPTALTCSRSKIVYGVLLGKVAAARSVAEGIVVDGYEWLTEDDLPAGQAEPRGGVTV
jgi:hypothetical protein